MADTRRQALLAAVAASLSTAAAAQTPPAQGQSDVTTWLQSYSDCVRNAAVRLGLFSRRAPGTVVIVARTRCTDRLRNAFDAMNDDRLVSPAVNARILSDFRRDVAKAAAQDLTEARAFAASIKAGQ